MNELVFPSLNSSTNHNPTLLLIMMGKQAEEACKYEPECKPSSCAVLFHLQQNKQRISYYHQRNSGLLRVLHCLQRLQLNTEEVEGHSPYPSSGWCNLLK